MAGRFDYVKYDKQAIVAQEGLKTCFEQLESHINTLLVDGRPKALALTSLEEAYMWIGKAIRDDQILRNSQTAHVPERSNS